MKKDIVIAGVGGQGILSIAAAIGMAAVNKGLYLKQAEVHGMSQRGGDVQSNLRIADYEIASDLIPLGKADLIISVEPMESLRYLPLLSEDGWLITNTSPYINIKNYPEEEQLKNEIIKVKNHIFFDANAVAKDLGTKKAANMVILGAATPYLGIDFEALEDSIRFIFKSKGEAIINLNLDALKKGREIGESQLV